MTSAEAPGASQPPVVRRLVGVYDADGTLRGEVAYFVGARLGRAHCSLCDITHGLVRRRADWQQLCGELGVPFDTFHRDDQPDEVRRATGGRVPVVVAITSDEASTGADGRVVVLLDPEALDRCAGSVDRFADALTAALAAADLTIG